MEIAISTGLDLAIAAIFIISIIICVKKGFLQSIVSLFGKAASLVVAFIFSKNLGVYIDTNYIREPMKQWLVNQLSPTADGVDASLITLDLDSLFRNKPEFFTKLADFLNVDISSLAQQYSKSLETSGQEMAKKMITNAMIEPLSALISRVIAFVIIFLICMIGLAVLWWLSDIVTNIPVLKQIDQTGGAILGIINAAVLTFVFVAVINLASGYIFRSLSLTEIENITDGTFLFSLFNKINPINTFLGGSL